MNLQHIFLSYINGSTAINVTPAMILKVVPGLRLWLIMIL